MRTVVLTLCALLLVPAVPAVADAPPRPHGRLSIACDRCHTPDSWRTPDLQERFDHRGTGFPLVGVHARLACRDCHRDLRFARVGVACLDCHTDPHRARLGTSCGDCHDPRGWDHLPDLRRRHEGAAFPLLGAHGRVDCDACHRGEAGQRFVGTPSDCIACHRDQYEATTAPDHVTAGFGTDCSLCHPVTATGWTGDSFVHDVLFPLRGAHAALDCDACHAQGYAGTPSDCFGCHQADYDATIDPDHTASGFPTDCAACHATRAWRPADWDHDGLFPIYSGSHRGEWDTCTDCHVSPTDYQVFECILCHEHNQTDTDRDHREVGGYVYRSSECYRCHPSGDGGD